MNPKKKSRNYNYKITRNIILASTSQRRRKILNDSGIKFKQVKTNINEDLLIKKLNHLRSDKLVKIISLLKAISILKRSSLNWDEIIAAFDTLVTCKGKIITKPKNNFDAYTKLSLLSNKNHKVYTGIAIIDLKKLKIVVDSEVTQVKMRKITKLEIKNYIKSKEPFGKAGCYAIQGNGGKFIKTIYGDYFNVVGLPLFKFISLLKQLD